MALRTHDMRRIRSIRKNKGIDRYIRTSIVRMHKINPNRKYIFTDAQIDKNNWKYGFDTDCCNNISLRRRRLYNIRKPTKNFVPYRRYRKKYRYASMGKYIPSNVISFIKKLKVR